MLKKRKYHEKYLETTNVAKHKAKISKKIKSVQVRINDSSDLTRVLSNKKYNSGMQDEDSDSGSIYVVRWSWNGWKIGFIGIK